MLRLAWHIGDALHNHGHICMVLGSDQPWQKGGIFLMDHLSDEMTELHTRILETAEDSRYLLQPSLAGLLNRMKAQGHEIPQDLRKLHDELTDAAIEAQFDNMPV